MGAGDRKDVEKKGHENVEADDKHPTGRGKDRSGLGKNYGQGIGYGGHGVEQDQAKSQTGTPDRIKEGK